VGRKRTRGNSRIGKGGGYYSTKKKDIQDITSRNKTTNLISGGGNWNYKANVDIKPLVIV
jgi:hypothetical protein